MAGARSWSSATADVRITPSFDTLHREGGSAVGRAALMRAQPSGCVSTARGGCASCRRVVQHWLKASLARAERLAEAEIAHLRWGSAKVATLLVPSSRQTQAGTLVSSRSAAAWGNRAPPCRGLRAARQASGGRAAPRSDLAATRWRAWGGRPAPTLLSRFGRHRQNAPDAEVRKLLHDWRRARLSRGDTRARATAAAGIEHGAVDRDRSRSGDVGVPAVHG